MTVPLVGSTSAGPPVRRPAGPDPAGTPKAPS